MSFLRRAPRYGLFAALLALTAQIGLAAGVPQPAAVLLGFGNICHAPGPHDSGRHARHVPPGAVSVLCIAQAMPTPPRTTPPALPAPRDGSRLADVPAWPAANAPALFPLAAAPRGPPAPKA